MLWSNTQAFLEEEFDSEPDLESAILEVAPMLFGDSRIYLDLKRRIGTKGKTKNIPDGYLIDLSSKIEPKLYLVENELAKHEPLKHIAVQILEFSLSFETTPHKIKEILKDALVDNQPLLEKCQQYAHDNGFENVDVLLEKMIYHKDAFNALLIIDELSEELEIVLLSRFKFPVETITLQRYRSKEGERLYRFEPFLQDVSGDMDIPTKGKPVTLDPAELDTIVVPAREDGFKETFLGENRWYKIRIHSSMIPKIKYIAAYQIAPVSAITHIAEVESIEQWPETSKYVVNFTGPAKKIRPISLVPRSKIKALQAPRYTSMTRLKAAKTMDEAF